MKTPDLNANSDFTIDDKLQVGRSDVPFENSHLSGESVTVSLLPKKDQILFSKHPLDETLVTQNRNEIEDNEPFAGRQEDNNQIKVNPEATESHVKFATTPADGNAIKTYAKTFDAEEEENFTQFAK